MEKRAGVKFSIGCDRGAAFAAVLRELQQYACTNCMRIYRPFCLF